MGTNQPETPIIEFFKTHGYSVTAPITLRGLSGFDERFDFSATKGEEQIVIDAVLGKSVVGPDKVVAFFAKVMDAKPRRSILICSPSLNHDAQSLVSMYKLEAVTANDVGNILLKLSQIFD